MKIYAAILLSILTTQVFAKTYNCSTVTESFLNDLELKTFVLKTGNLSSSIEVNFRAEGINFGNTFKFSFLSIPSLVGSRDTDGDKVTYSISSRMGPALEASWGVETEFFIFNKSDKTLSYSKLTEYSEHSPYNANETEATDYFVAQCD